MGATSAGYSRYTGLNTMAQRLDGLDLARFLAFVGMVVVNFKIAMGAENEVGTFSLLTGTLEGRAAATFVVLAGIGLGLAAMRSEHVQTVSVTIKRAVFLLALGLLNSLIFDADILHYYAFYFLFGVLLIRANTHSLVTSITLLNLAFVAMIFVFDYDTAWDWNNYSYADFWTPIGFIRNLFFNGWHPVIPWLGFLLYGIVLSRTSLSDVSTQHRLILFGMIAFIVAEVASVLISGPLHTIDPELVIFATTEPVPPMPLYTLAGLGAASFVVGFCLRFSDWFRRIGVLRIVTPAGRQTLTLYIAHILIGMGTLEALDMLGGQSLSTSVAASILFCVLATIYAFVWSRFVKRGPIEAAMRSLGG